LIAAGLVGLWFGSDLMVSCSVKVAWRLRFPALLVGLTIVSFGTSLPEMAVGITAALELNAGIDTSGVIIGDNIGSFISQLLLVLGISGLFKSIHVPKRSIKRDALILPISVAIFAIACLDETISRLDGLFFIAVYTVYNLYVFLQERKTNTEIGEEVKVGVCWREQHPLLDLFYLIIGGSLVILASILVVDNSIEIAKLLGVDPFIIGVVLVGIGTSLPELVVSIKSTRKGESDLSIGNVIGSNVTDLLLVTAIAAIIAENLTFHLTTLYFDLSFAFITSIIFLVLVRSRMKIDKPVSSFLIGSFLFYIIFKLLGI
jgi:cation:H+ antiporter